MVKMSKYNILVCFLPGNYPEESIQHSEHGESLKSNHNGMPSIKFTSPSQENKHLPIWKCK